MVILLLVIEINHWSSEVLKQLGGHLVCISVDISKCKLAFLTAYQLDSYCIPWHMKFNVKNIYIRRTCLTSQWVQRHVIFVIYTRMIYGNECSWNNISRIINPNPHIHQITFFLTKVYLPLPTIQHCSLSKLFFDSSISSTWAHLTICLFLCWSYSTVAICWTRAPWRSPDDFLMTV